MNSAENSRNESVTQGNAISEVRIGEVTSSNPSAYAQRIDVLEQKTKDLKDKSDEIEKSLVKSEKNQDKALTFMMGIASVIVIAFFLALIPLLFDYYKDNAERYENFTKRIDKLDMKVEILENKKTK